MKKIIIIFLFLNSTSVFAADGIVEITKRIIEVQYSLYCGEPVEMKQSFFRPIREREEISCKDTNGVTQVVIQTEAKAKAEPLYKVQVLAATPEFKL